MKIQNLLLVACLLQAILVSANITPSTAPLFISAAQDTDPCNLPAPTNFHVESEGPTWVLLQWDFPMASANHRIRVFRVSDNALLSTTNILSAQNNAMIVIPFNTPVYALINAICKDGSHSPITAEARPNGLIPDLIVAGYINSNNVADCTLSQSGSCTFGNTDEFEFQVEIAEIGSAFFGLQMRPDLINSTIYFDFDPQLDNSASDFRFYCDASGTRPCEGASIKVRYWTGLEEIEIVSFTISQSSDINFLHASIIEDFRLGHVLVSRLSPGNKPLAPSDPGPVKKDRSNHGQSFSTAKASPNPFSETLDLSLPQASVEYANLQLFNLSGQKVEDLQYGGNQQYFHLPTAHLAPGFYMLRVEVDGAVQTLKVIKSE